MDYNVDLRYFKRARTEYILQSVNELMTMSRMSLKQYYDLLSQADRMNDGLNFMRDILEVLNDARAQNNDDTHVVELLSQLKADMDNTRGNIDKRQEDLKEIRAQLERTFTQQKPLEFSQSDEFVYNISILSREDGAHDAASSTHCRATLDTGCHDNWVSIGIIKRADLQDSIITITDSDKFESFSGHTMEPQGQIELTFFLATASGSSQQTRTEAFYVFDQLPVDLVLGKGFIAKQFTLVSKHALGLVRQGKFTQGLYLRLDFYIYLDLPATPLSPPSQSNLAMNSSLTCVLHRGSPDDRDITEEARCSEC